MYAVDSMLSRLSCMLLVRLNEKAAVSKEPWQTLDSCDIWLCVATGSGPGRREDYMYYLIIDKGTKMSCAAEELFEFFFRLQKKGDVTSTLSTKIKSDHKIIQS